MILADRLDLLANISILLEAQEKMGLQRSQRLGTLFQKHWDELRKELEDGSKEIEGDSRIRSINGAVQME